MRDELLSVAVDYLGTMQEPFASNRVANHIRTEVPAAVRRRMSTDYDDLVIKGSAGQGVWAAVPWVAFFDPLETKLGNVWSLRCVLVQRRYEAAVLIAESRHDSSLSRVWPSIW